MPENVHARLHLTRGTSLVCSSSQDGCCRARRLRARLPGWTPLVARHRRRVFRATFLPGRETKAYSGCFIRSSIERPRWAKQAGRRAPVAAHSKTDVFRRLDDRSSCPSCRSMSRCCSRTRFARTLDGRGWPGPQRSRCFFATCNTAPRGLPALENCIPGLTDTPTSVTLEDTATCHRLRFPAG
jgi:hypothetical protein